MSKFADRIKNVFTVDYDDYDEDYYDDYEDDDMDFRSLKSLRKRNVQQRADLNVFQQEGFTNMMTTL